MTGYKAIVNTGNTGLQYAFCTHSLDYIVSKVFMYVKMKWLGTLLEYNAHSCQTCCVLFTLAACHAPWRQSLVSHVSTGTRVWRLSYCHWHTFRDIYSIDSTHYERKCDTYRGKMPNWEFKYSGIFSVATVLEQVIYSKCNLQLLVIWKTSYWVEKCLAWIVIDQLWYFYALLSSNTRC